MCAASLKFENEVHLGHIWFSEAGFVQCFERREQFRRSVFFCGHLPPAEMASFFIKNTDLQKKQMEHIRFFAPIACFPRK